MTVCLFCATTGGGRNTLLAMSVPFLTERSDCLQLTRREAELMMREQVIDSPFHLTIIQTFLMQF